MDRMSPLDASFLHVENDANHMHIGSVGIFEGPAPNYGDFADLVAGKLPLVPRYRQKVRTCLDVFARMLSEARFDPELRSMGLEIELNLTDEAGDPAMLNATVLEAIADNGLAAAVARDRALAGGVNVVDGKITYEAVAEAHNLDYTPLEDVLGASAVES